MDAPQSDKPKNRKGNRRGNWKPGESGNPNGRPRGYQSFVDRAKYLLGKLSVGEILDRVNAIRTPKDPKLRTPEWKKNHDDVRKMPALDLAIMMRIADAFTAGGGDGLEKIVDRILGKPTQTLNIDQNVNGTFEHFSVSELDSWVKGRDTDKAQGTPEKAVLN